jgi:hypothetical protein
MYDNDRHAKSATAFERCITMRKVPLLFVCTSCCSYCVVAARHGQPLMKEDYEDRAQNRRVAIYIKLHVMRAMHRRSWETKKIATANRNCSPSIQNRCENISQRLLVHI